MKKSRVWILEAVDREKRVALSCADCPEGTAEGEHPECAVKSDGVWTLACEHLLHDYEGVGDDGGAIRIVVCSHGRDAAEAE